MRTHITAETLFSVESFHVATGRKNAYSIEETTSIHVRFVVLLKRGTQTRLKDGRHVRRSARLIVFRLPRALFQFEQFTNFPHSIQQHV